MSQTKEEASSRFDELRAVRDDLEVRINLAKLEARDLWEDLEKKMSHAEGKVKVLAEAAEDVLEDVGEAAKSVLDEIEEGYEKLKRLL